MDGQNNTDITVSNPLLSQYIHASKYGRFQEHLGRREVYTESVDRYFDYIQDHAMRLKPERPQELSAHLEAAKATVKSMGAVPSMRALATAGPALSRDNTAGYNCAYMPISDLRAFGELLYILMCGTGVGYSVERRYVSQLPPVPRITRAEGYVTVEDSKKGWKDALDEWLTILFTTGKDHPICYAKVRPEGSPLRTFGGRASGPGPLKKSFAALREILYSAQGRQLRPLEVHDMCCYIAEAVISGGVRRSAMISLSDLDDKEMAMAKHGAWWKTEPQRALSNNSAVIDGGVEWEEFKHEWDNMVRSMAGERGIFSRDAARKKAEAMGRDPNIEYGCNPCSEIILRPYQFCNLSEAIVRADDDLMDLVEKVQAAAVMGTVQSTLDYFPELRPEWTQNAAEERLLGVSLTGICDSPFLSGAHLENSRDRDLLVSSLEHLRRCVRTTNHVVANLLGIRPAAAATCIKPSGTVSQLADTASGIHPRYSKHYLRTVRESKDSPVAQFMRDKGVYHETDYMDETNYVFYFPVSAPEAPVTGSDFQGIDQLELWKTYNRHWCDHKPSMTCYLPQNEGQATDAIRDWVWEHLDELDGVAFLPYDGHVYEQAPYIPVSQYEIEQWFKDQPSELDWTELVHYETEDNTTQAQEFACSSGTCDIF